MRCAHPGCDRGTNIRYTGTKMGADHRTRLCSQGHVTYTIEITRKSHTSMVRLYKLLINPGVPRADLQMAISNLIGDIG